MVCLRVVFLRLERERCFEAGSREAENSPRRDRKIRSSAGEFLHALEHTARNEQEAWAVIKKTTLKLKFYLRRERNDDDSAATLYRPRSSPSVRPQASRRSFPFTTRGAGDGEPAAVPSTPPSPNPFEQGLARSGVALVFLLLPPPFPSRIASASRRMAARIRLRSSYASCAVTVSAKLG